MQGVVAARGMFSARLRKAEEAVQISATHGESIFDELRRLLFSIQLARQRRGDSLANAYRHAVAFTGKVVGLVGVTLAVGVVMWISLPIKFQADMGILLSFMFIWNMLGVLVLIPALSYFLLNGRIASSDGNPPIFSGGQKVG